MNLKIRLMLILAVTLMGQSLWAELPLVEFQFGSQQNPLNKEQTYATGDFGVGVLRIYPNKNELEKFSHIGQEFNSNESILKQYKESIEKLASEKYLFNVIKLVEIEKFSVSPNNVDVLEYQVSFIFMEPIEKANWSISFDGVLIPVKYLNNSSVRVVATKFQDGDYYILNQKIKKFPIQLIAFGLLTFGLLSMAGWIWKKRKNTIPSREIDWIENLQEARDRKNFEELYRKKLEWAHLISDEKKMEQFLGFINAIQFQRTWSEFELSELRKWANELSSLAKVDKK